MGESFAVTVTDSNAIPIISVKGYLGEIAGQEICQKVDLLLMQGKKVIVFDFTETRIINSPGVTALMDLAIKIRDDFGGTFFLTGIDSVKKKILSMVGVATADNVKPTLQAAVNLAKQFSQ